MFAQLAKLLTDTHGLGPVRFSAPGVTVPRNGLSQWKLTHPDTDPFAGFRGFGDGLGREVLDFASGLARAGKLHAFGFDDQHTAPSTDTKWQLVLVAPTSCEDAFQERVRPFLGQGVVLDAL